MASATTQTADHFRGEDFASLLDETLGRDTGFDGSVVRGRVVRLTDDYAIVDVGLKSEGRVALREFAPQGVKPEVKPGDIVELYMLNGMKIAMAALSFPVKKHVVKKLGQAWKRLSKPITASTAPFMAV